MHKDFQEPLRELSRLVEGREIELKFHGQLLRSSIRASVFVRGDERDGYRQCLVSGCGRTMGQAIRNAIKRWELVVGTGGKISGENIFISANCMPVEQGSRSKPLSDFGNS